MADNFSSQKLKNLTTVISLEHRYMTSYNEKQVKLRRKNTSIKLIIIMKKNC